MDQRLRPSSQDTSFVWTNRLCWPRGRISAPALLNLSALQDMVYACDDAGNLTTIYDGIAILQGDTPLDFGSVPSGGEVAVQGSPVTLIDLTIDRSSVGYQRNWPGFHQRRWDADPRFFEQFVMGALGKRLGIQEAQRVLQLDTHQRRLTFVESLGREIWESEFENYSRFTGTKIPFKTGDETVRNIAGGAGGICAEKVQALKFLTDHYGFESEYLVGGDGASGSLPITELRRLLESRDFTFARRYMRYWQHTALLYDIDGVPVLVDVTNGNIPFLFLVGPSAEEMLREEGKKGAPVRMVEAEEEYFYHRTPQDIPLNLFFAMESWIGETDLVQVFENELGLYLSSQYYVTPIPFRSEREFQRLEAQYTAIAARAGFACQISKEWELNSGLGREFAQSHPSAARGILESKEELLVRYNGWDVPGHDAGLAIFRLT